MISSNGNGNRPEAGSGLRPVLPWQFNDEAFQFTPLKRGNMRSPWTGDQWRDNWLGYEEASWWLAEQGDVGVRLSQSALLVIDCDRITGMVPVEGGRTMKPGVTVDGHAAMRAWLGHHQTDLPE